METSCTTAHLSVSFVVMQPQLCETETAAGVNLSMNTGWLCALLYGPEELLSFTGLIRCLHSGGFTQAQFEKFMFTSMCRNKYVVNCVLCAFVSKTEGYSVM